RVEIKKTISANLASTLTLSLALKVARKFSNGAVVKEGQGWIDKKWQGTFNVCYWVAVEGQSQQWVVRFPLLGILPYEVMTAKFNSEVATMKFLRDRTRVRVPRLIGYGFGDDDESPVPFMIMEN